MLSAFTKLRKYLEVTKICLENLICDINHYGLLQLIFLYLSEFLNDKTIIIIYYHLYYRKIKWERIYFMYKKIINKI